MGQLAYFLNLYAGSISNMKLTPAIRNVRDALTMTDLQLLKLSNDRLHDICEDKKRIIKIFIATLSRNQAQTSNPIIGDLISCLFKLQQELLSIKDTECIDSKGFAELEEKRKRVIILEDAIKEQCAKHKAIIDAISPDFTDHLLH